MPTRKPKDDQDEIDIIEAWLMDIERCHSCLVRIVLGHSPLKGRLYVRVEAAHVVEGRLASIITRNTSTYPNGDAVRLVGHIARELVKLDKDLTDYAALGVFSPLPNAE